MPYIAFVLPQGEKRNDTNSHMPALQEQIERETLFVNDLLAQINQVIVGQEKLVERVLTALLADGHVLLEGVPGLAKPF